MKKLIAAGIAGAALLASTLPAFAHEALTFVPGPGCMGRLTSFHAKDPGHGLRHNAEGMPHQGIAVEMGVPSATNFQEFMKLQKAYPEYKKQFICI